MEIAAGKFKAECLRLMDHVHETHEEIIITKRGRQIAKLVPIGGNPEKNIYGWMKDSVIFEDDIISPIEEKWDVE